MARLEEEEAGNPQTAREWLDRAIAAPPDPTYVCERCGAESMQWASLCRACGSFDTLAWKTPSAQFNAAAASYQVPVAAPLMLPPEDAPVSIGPPTGAPLALPSRLAPNAQSDK